MLASIVTLVRTTLMRLKLFMMWCRFIRRSGVPSLCYEVKRGEALELGGFSWLNLPDDMQWLILSKLEYVDVSKLACVCTSWKRVIKTLPLFYPAGKTPLLIDVKSRGEQGAYIHYYSPLIDKTFQTVSHLNLIGYDMISAIGDKILVFKKDEKGTQFRLLNPLTSEELAHIPMIAGNIIFNGCVVGCFEPRCTVLASSFGFHFEIFLIDTSHEEYVTVHVYRHYDDIFAVNYWTLNLVYGNRGQPFHLVSNPVYLDGRVYCLGGKGNRLGIFDMSRRTWIVYPVKLINYHDISSRYLVGWLDTPMLVQVQYPGSRIYLFDLEFGGWTKVWKEAYWWGGGRSLFLGSTVSAMSRPTAKKLRNRVFLPHYHDGDEPKTVIVADAVRQGERLFFVSRRPMSNEEERHAASTFCWCNNIGNQLHLGSTWFQP